MVVRKNSLSIKSQGKKSPPGVPDAGCIKGGNIGVLSVFVLTACACFTLSVRGVETSTPADMPPASGTPGGDGGIRGIVLDSEFDSPVPLAEIKTAEADVETRSGEDGRFRLVGLKSGVYTVIVSKSGYSRGVVPQVIVAGSGLSEVTVALRPDLTEMDEMVVEEVEIAEPKSEEGLLELRETSLSFQDSVGKNMMSQAGASDGAGGDFKLSLDSLSDAASEEAEAVFSMEDLDQAPKATVQVPPEYPKELGRKKLRGTVKIVFIVDKSGRVVNPIVQSSSHPAFANPALRAVRRWRFEPGKRGGAPVQFKMRVPIVFASK